MSPWPLNSLGEQPATDNVITWSGGAPVWKAPAAASLPAGLIVMWSGTLANIPSGWNLCDGTLGTPDLRDRFIKGPAAAEEPGATGGASTHTHAGHANHVVTQPSAHAALVHSGTAVADHPSHTHTYTDVVNHVHVENQNSATTGSLIGWAARDTSTSTSSATGYSTANPTGGVATGTTAGPSAVLSHVVTQPTDHAAQSHSGTAVDAHSAHDTPNSEPLFFKLAFLMKA